MIERRGILGGMVRGKNAGALEFIEKQTPEICLAAVRQDGRALWYVKKQTQEICRAAARQNSRAINFVKADRPRPEPRPAVRETQPAKPRKRGATKKARLIKQLAALSPEQKTKTIQFSVPISCMKNI
jgi:hypothetical protein